MTLRLGDVAPDFDAETTEGPIRFHDFPSWELDDQMVSAARNPGVDVYHHLPVVPWL
jgi:hypothetical protein